MFSRLVRGGAWLGLGSGSEYAFRFVRNMVLARLLAPEAFGLMAIVISVCSLFQVLTGLGVKESIVQSPRGAERTYLNGAWWLSVSRGLLLYLAALAAAPWLARFYNAPELTHLLRIAFISVLAQSALSVEAFVAVKQMRYPKWVMIQQGGSLIGITATLLLAIWLKGVLALVIGYAIEGIVRMFISFLVCPFKPGLSFDKEDTRALLCFAGGMFGLPILMLIYNEGAVFAVGKLCTKEQLGIFAMALTLARTPSMFSGQIVDLLMPAFCEIQGNLRRVNESVLKITAVVVLVGLPAASFIAVYGKQILSVLYGPKYGEGGTVLALLFLNELMLVCSVPIATVYMAIGQPNLVRRFSLIRAFFVVFSAWPLITWWNITGAAIVPLGAMLLSFRFQLVRLREVTGLKLVDYFKPVILGLLFAGILASFFLFTAPFFKAMKPIPGLAGAVILTIIPLSITAFFFSRHPGARQIFSYPVRKS